ncbi:VOC family protein [Hahella aquimaris]|uniref:VOC family protein n=1 Tax=Hahella sp. HNIBRBA332 TaxID=3015983 RepID=UPI00273C6536|nr:VOC family protein [Hahella sp. HNIBRBA332]WLQ15858.1 VOC family protein [Hahella sp. HNIBRBA332]
MIDHFSIDVTNIEESLAWYRAVLKPLGYEVKFEVDQDVRVVALGESKERYGSLYLVESKRKKACDPRPHFCFRATSEEQVKAFLTAAIKAGGMGNRTPGYKVESGFHAAFVYDPDGYNVEATHYIKK